MEQQTDLIISNINTKEVIGKTINIYCIYKRIYNIIKNLQTKCMKNEWIRSSFVLDTISLKQISPFTQSLWCFETRGHLPHRIKWFIAWKWSTQGRVLQTTQCLFLSLWHKMKHKIFSGGEFFFLSCFLWMRDYELLYVTKQVLCFSNNCYAQTNWFKN